MARPTKEYQAFRDLTDRLLAVPRATVEKRIAEHRESLTPDELADMLHLQHHRCAICHRRSLEFRKPLGVDHDHKTGKIRGLLCAACNLGLGAFKDDFDVLIRAAQYIQRHRQYPDRSRPTPSTDWQNEITP